MIRQRTQFAIAHDNPILARVRQFYDTLKSDPYIIFVENKNTTSIQVDLFDAQNNIGVQNRGLPIGVSVNTSFNYSTGSNLTSSFNTGTGTFNAGTTASFAGKGASYDLGGLTISQAAEVFQNDTTFSISTIIVRDGASARLDFKFATDDDTLTDLVVGAQTFALTKTDSGYTLYAGARSTYLEFLQQVSIRPMSMEGNFFESTNPAVIQSNDIFVTQADVTGENQKRFLSANLDPYMRSSQRTLPNFNMINGETTLTLTLPATSRTTFFLFSTMEMDVAEQLSHEVDPENMDDAKIEGDEKPFDDYILPTDGYSF
tara:strand:- start:685 stop:1632 length:948 start_codon:yes stop_codon:yes gene_type:complete